MICPIHVLWFVFLWSTLAPPHLFVFPNYLPRSLPYPDFQGIQPTNLIFCYHPGDRSHTHNERQTKSRILLSSIWLVVSYFLQEAPSSHWMKILPLQFNISLPSSQQCQAWSYPHWDEVCWIPTSSRCRLYMLWHELQCNPFPGLPTLPNFAWRPDFSTWCLESQDIECHNFHNNQQCTRIYHNKS